FNYATGDGEAPDGVSEPEPMPVKFDLTVTVAEAGDGLAGEVQYSTALFDTERMVRLVGHFQQVLAAVAGDAAVRLSAVPVLTGVEQEMLASWNATAVPVSWSGGVLDRFAGQVAADPD